LEISPKLTTSFRGKLTTKSYSLIEVKDVLSFRLITGLFYYCGHLEDTQFDVLSKFGSSHQFG